MLIWFYGFNWTLRWWNIFCFFISSLSVTQIETDVQNLKSDVATLTDLQNTTSFLRSGINDKIARLREKLRIAQNTIADSDQPVRLAGQSSLSIVKSVSKYMLHSEIQLDVRPEQRDGLVFFTENPSENSFMSVEIIASRINFRFRVYEDLVSISSPIDVCCGEWYRVLATRYMLYNVDWIICEYKF